MIRNQPRQRDLFLVLCELSEMLEFLSDDLESTETTKCKCTLCELIDIFVEVFAG